MHCLQFFLLMLTMIYIHFTDHDTEAQNGKENLILLEICNVCFLKNVRSKNLLWGPLHISLAFPTSPHTLSATPSLLMPSSSHPDHHYGIVERNWEAGNYSDIDSSAHWTPVHGQLTLPVTYLCIYDTA